MRTPCCRFKFTRSSYGRGSRDYDEYSCELCGKTISQMDDEPHPTSHPECDLSSKSWLEIQKIREAK